MVLLVPTPWLTVVVGGTGIVVRIVVLTVVGAVDVLGNGIVDRVETVVRDTVVRIEMEVRLVVDEGGGIGLERDVGTEPAGPERYQLASGSPRHSPTVTALYPCENSEVKM